MENFKVIKTLGSGSFGTVQKVQRIEDKQIYALKKVKINGMDAKDRKNALNEVRILASLNHPQIIGYKEAFFDESSKSLCMIMEYAEGGDLQKVIDTAKKGYKNIPESQMWKYCIQMINGIKYLHENKIVHRDLKCANVFLTKDGDIKLGDLNVSKVNRAGLMFTQTGTPYYASPEVWKDKPYDAKSDIWSLGCVLYELCALRPPFTATDMKGLYTKVVKGSYNRIPKMYSDDLANIIDMCLKVSPSKRLGAQSLLRTKEIVVHLRESGVEEEKKESSTSLLDTIKLPSNFKLLKGKLPVANYESDLETIEPVKPKIRNYSARGRMNYDLNGNLRKREGSLSALKNYQAKPSSSNSQLNISRIGKYQKIRQLPPKSNRPANYRRNYDRPGLQLPPISSGSAAGIPSVANYRIGRSIESSRVLPLRQYHSNKSVDYDRGYKRRRADIASRHKIQQQLISKAFGLPITPIRKH